MADPGSVVTLRGHMPALDGVRGLAILMVLVVHFIGDIEPTSPFERWVSQLTSYGAMGVDLFFVLSGFLITGILCDSRKKPFYFRNFYARRVLRIFPLYFGVLMLGLWVLPRFVTIPRLDVAVREQAWLWAYSANFLVGIKGSWEALPIFNHFWSLAVEEHFYLVWPLVVFVFPGHKLKQVAWIIVCGALLTRMTMIAAGINEIAVYAMTPGRLDALAMGGLMAVIARDEGGITRLRRFAPRGLVVGGVFIAGTYLLTRLVPQWQPVSHQIRQTTFAVCFCTLLIYALTGPPLIRGFFESRAMTFFGKYSYGLYVFHFLYGYFMIQYDTVEVVAATVGSHTLAIFVQAILATGLSVVLALLSYHTFEKHFLKLKVRF